MKDPAPIAMFVYNRPEHTRRSLEALEQNPLSRDSILHIFSDGPKSNTGEEDLHNIAEVRKLIREKSWCKEVIIHESTVNQGLATSLISGINEIMQHHESVIVLEDDILTSPDFLQFCNQGLIRYEHDEKVWQVSGYMFPLRGKLPETFLLPTVACWGWATWKRAWLKYNSDPKFLMAEIQSGNLEYSFNLNGSYPYLQMLKDRILGRNQSWAICWYATIFLNRGLSLYPGQTRAVNIGMDGSGTHWKGSGTAQVLPTLESVNGYHFPGSSEADIRVQRKLETSLRKTYFPSIYDRIFRKLVSLFPS
ncbi:MAG TPA: glycosyltransferase family 2 protein [Bacteroidia bacterium]|nr:glycosyltransferase family 2 protein [Bacteroidia bacterium]